MPQVDLTGVAPEGQELPPVTKQQVRGWVEGAQGWGLAGVGRWERAG